MYACMHACMYVLFSARTHALTQVLTNLKELDLSMNLYTQMPDQLLWKDRYFVEV